MTSWAFKLISLAPIQIGAYFLCVDLWVGLVWSELGNKPVEPLAFWRKGKTRMTEHDLVFFFLLYLYL